MYLDDWVVELRTQQGRGDACRHGGAPPRAAAIRWSLILESVDRHGIRIKSQPRISPKTYTRVPPESMRHQGIGDTFVQWLGVGVSGVIAPPNCRVEPFHDHI